MSGKNLKEHRRAIEAQLQQHRARRESSGTASNTLNLDPGRIHPRGEQVLVAIEIEKETEGGIIVPEVAQTPGVNGLPVAHVLAVGPEVKTLKVDDLVLVPQAFASKIDTLLWLAPESKVLCTIDPKPRLVVAQPA